MAVEDRIKVILDAEANLQGFIRFIAALDILNSKLVKNRVAMHQANMNWNSAFKSMGDQVMSSQAVQKTYWDNYFANNKKATNLTKDVTTGVKQKTQAFAKFDQVLLSVGLSLLFTGMAIKRVTEGALRSMITTFMEATNWKDKFHQKLNALSAAIEYFKFSFIQALSQSPLFLALIDGVINLMNWLSQLDPRIKVLAGLFLILGAVVGTAMMFIGQAFLVLTPIALVFGKAVALAFLQVLGAIALVAVALGAIYLVWTSDQPKILKLLETLGIALLAVAGIAAIFGAAWLAVPLAVIGGCILALTLAWNAWGDKFIIWMKILLNRALWLWTDFYYNIRIGLGNALNFIIDQVQNFINWLNRALGRFSPFKGLSVSKFKIDTSALESEKFNIEHEWNVGMQNLSDEWNKLDQESKQTSFIGNIKEAVKNGIKDILPDMKEAIKDGAKEGSSEGTSEGITLTDPNSGKSTIVIPGMQNPDIWYQQNYDKYLGTPRGG